MRKERRRLERVHVRAKIDAHTNQSDAASIAEDSKEESRAIMYSLLMRWNKNSEQYANHLLLKSRKQIFRSIHEFFFPEGKVPVMFSLFTSTGSYLYP